MKRWEIRPSPGSDDAQRHLLLIEGGPADVSAILKRFGALCGRPGPADVAGFDLALVLHKLTDEKRGKLEKWLGEVAPAAPPPASEPTPEPTPVPAPVASTPPPVPDIPALVPPPANLPPAESPLISLSPEPAPPPPATAPPVILPPTVPPPVTAPPVTAPPVAATPPPAPISAPAPAPAPAPVAAAPAPVAPPTSSPPPLSVLVAPLRSDWTFDSLLVGAYNRFAHAAAMSVVSSPGSMYNPLFLYGVPGTGKSHMLHAIGAGLSKGLGDAVLLSTSGSRLSRAVNAAAARKTLAELEKKAADSKALLIDDIHLLAIDDGNKEFLGKLFKSFFDRGLQVVITSLYPPRALSALEEALKFSFSKGWSVDLKIPSPAVQKDLIVSAGDRANAGWTVDDMSLLHEKLSVWGYSDLSLWLRRLSVLKKLKTAAGQPAGMADMLTLIYDPLVAVSTAPPTPEQAAATRFAPPTVSAAAPALGVLAPKGMDGQGPFAASLFYEIGARNGVTSAFRHALWETYDAGQSFGVPFQIGDMCARAGVTRVLLVGPGGDSPLAARAAEFSHAVRRILESGGIQLGFIPHTGLQNPAQYINAQLDLAADP